MRLPLKATGMPTTASTAPGEKWKMTKKTRHTSWIYACKNRLVGEETSLKFYQGLKESFSGYNTSVKNLMNATKENNAVALVDPLF